MLVTAMKELIQRIGELKRERNAVILAHYYQEHVNYEVADYIGDSLELSRRAAETKADVIVFAGVYFMAETAKILNYDRTVLLPNIAAICEMVGMVSPEHVRQLKEQHPGSSVVAYVNTSAAVKAEADICCTSSNAVKVVSSLNSDTIIFVPDQNLARYVRSQTSKRIEIPAGYCYVHKDITLDIIKAKKAEYPNARVLAHPECDLAVLEQADYVASTSGMFSCVESSDAKEFIVATEEGLVHELRKRFPHKVFYAAGGVCRGMKATSLEDIKNSLEKLVHEVMVPEDIAKKARISIDRMLSVI